MSTQFLAGAAVRDITPTPEIAGKHSLRPWENVRFDELGSPLRVKGIAMESGDMRVILLALDLVGLENAQCDAIRHEVSDAIGLQVEDIIVTASHSHSTPNCEPLDGPHPFFTLVKERSVEAAKEAWTVRSPARVGHGITYAVGASFNQNIYLPGDRVKYTRDFREGLASGRPVDPRLNVIRVDDENGKPIAGWVRFAAHPACVIFDSPVSAEYPGYMTDWLSQECAGGAPVLFGYGASGDVNCIPMFGTEDDSRNLGLSLAHQAAPVFEGIQTATPRRFMVGSRRVDLPLDPPPSVEVLDGEIKEVRDFIQALDTNPDLEWVLGINCVKDWSVEAKRAYTQPLMEWAEYIKQAIQAGRQFPASWPSALAAMVIDDLGLVFSSCEPFTALGLELAARSPLQETLLMALSNGANAYVGPSGDHRRGGYQLHTNVRYGKLAEGQRLLPYGENAGDCLIRDCLAMLNDLCHTDGQ